MFLTFCNGLELITCTSRRVHFRPFIGQRPFKLYFKQKKNAYDHILTVLFSHNKRFELTLREAFLLDVYCVEFIQLLDLSRSKEATRT